MTIFVNRLGNIPLGRMASNSQGVQVSLAPGQVLALDGDKRGFEILCQRDPLWITQANDLEDHLLTSGEKFMIYKTGTIVIQGVQQGMLRISPRSSSPFDSRSCKGRAEK